MVDSVTGLPFLWLDLDDQSAALKSKGITDVDSFSQHYSFTYPSIIYPSNFAEEIKFLAQDEGDLKEQFKECANLMIQKLITGRGNQSGAQAQQDARSDHNMITRVTLADWCYFVGLNEKQVKSILRRNDDLEILHHTDVTAVLDYFNALSPEQLQALKIARRVFKSIYFNSATTAFIFKYLDGNGITWYVRKDVDLPWFIPIDSNYYNSKAVYPPTYANPVEMAMMGRIVHANRNLYDIDNIDHLMKSMRRMSDLLIPTGSEALVNYYKLFSIGKHFYFYKPLIDLLVLYTNHLHYCLFLFFKSDVVHRNLDKVLVPKGTTICHFSGEVRPMDESCPNPNDMQFDKSNTLKGLYVITNMTYQSGRPGVGNCSVFANCCCNSGTNYFASAESNFEISKSNVIKNGHFIDKHVVVVAIENITGKTILEFNQHNRAVFPLWFNAECIEPNEMIFPVEFSYGKPESNQVQADEKSNTMCMCMTNCSNKIPEERGRLHFAKEPPRPRTETSRDAIRAWKRMVSLPKLGSAQEDYIDWYLKQFPR